MQYTQEQKVIVKEAMSLKNDILVQAGAGVGKEQPLTSKVLTPNGYVEMGSLKVGDKVCSPNKTDNTVQAIFPQGIKDVYEVHFSDDSVVECGLEHLWRVESITWNRPNNRGFRTVSLKDILSTTLKTKNGFKYRVPLTEVEYSEKDLPIDPYLLGCLIADGSLHDKLALSLHSMDIELLDVLGELLPDGSKFGGIRNTSENGLQANIVRTVRTREKATIVPKLEELGLMYTYSKDKFIPRLYLNSSIEQRVALLRGLMDCDGTVGDRNRVSYSTSSKQLMLDLIELVKSLGGLCSYLEDTRKANVNYKIVVRFNDLNPFKLPRKADKVSPRKQNKVHKKITKIVKTDKAVEQQCISLDGDNLYITDGYTTTHNTTLLFNIFRHMRNTKFLLLSFNRHLTIEYVAKKKRFRLDNVDAMTLHKLAKSCTLDAPSVVIEGERFSRNGGYYNIVPFIHATELQEITGINGWKVSTLLREFCKSKDTFAESSAIILDIFKHYFSKMEVTHDMYLKLFQLGVQSGTISLKDKYDVVALDECQDMQESVIDLFCNMDIPRKIAVGDEYQAILGFLLEGYNAFSDERLIKFKRFPLTKSFRCSPTIADGINRSVLQPFLHAKFNFRGNEAFDYEDKSEMHLARTNNEVLKVAYNKAITGTKFRLSVKLPVMMSSLKSLTHVLSKTVELTLCLKPKEVKKIIPHAEEEVIKDVMMFVGRSARDVGLRTYLKKYSSSNIKSGFTLLMKLKDMDISIDDFENTIKNGISNKSDIKISNVHLVKGSEAGTVTLHWFKTPYELQEDCVETMKKSGTIDIETCTTLTFDEVESTYPTSKAYLAYLEELYILYVAMSRAKHTLKFNRCGVHEYWKGA